MKVPDGSTAPMQRFWTTLPLMVTFVALASTLGIVLSSLMGGPSAFAARPYINALVNLVFFGWFAAMGAGGALGGALHIRSRLLGVLVAVLVVMAVSGALFGPLGPGFSVPYYASDLLYALNMLMGLVVGAAALSQGPPEGNRLFHGLGWGLAAALLVNDVSVVMHLDNSDYASVFAVLYLALCLYEPRFRHKVLLPLVLISMAVTLPQMSRGIVLCLLGCGLVTALATRRLAATLLVLALAGAVVAASGGVMLSLLPRDSQAHRRMEETLGLASGRATRESAVSTYQRLYEAQAVRAQYRASGWVWAPFGFGDGATIDMRGAADDSVTGAALLGRETVHNLHLLPVALFYRSGVMGLAWLAMLVCAIASSAWRLRRARPRMAPGEALLALGALNYAAAVLFYGLPASNVLLSDPVNGLALAVLLTLLSRQATPAPVQARGAHLRTARAIGRARALAARAISRAAASAPTG